MLLNARDEKLTSIGKYDSGLAVVVGTMDAEFEDRPSGHLLTDSESEE